MEKLLAILSDEKDYSQGLAAYLNSRQDFGFRAVAFTELSLYQKYQDDNHIDMLLYDEDMEGCSEELFTADSVCMLSELSMVADQSGSGAIFKYQSSELMAQAITDTFLKRDCDAPVKTSQPSGTRIISVCSPIGGSYGSTYALGLAAYYSHGGRTLFVSFDPFFTVPGDDRQTPATDLGDLFYYLETQNADSLGVVEKHAVKKGKLEYLRGVAHWYDIYDMSPKLMQRFADSFANNAYYETIIIDVGRIGESSTVLLDLAQSVYVPCSGRGLSKIEEWKRQLEMIGRKDIIGKLSMREIPFDELLDSSFGLDNLLKGRIGKYIEETEAQHYIR